jgi:hypothetical protein
MNIQTISRRRQICLITPVRVRDPLPKPSQLSETGEMHECCFCSQSLPESGPDVLTFVVSASDPSNEVVGNAAALVPWFLPRRSAGGLGPVRYFRLHFIAVGTVPERRRCELW